MTVTEQTPAVDLDAAVQIAADDLDAWTREVVEWHFNPETGCPFWLDFAKRLDWNPPLSLREGIRRAVSEAAEAG